MSGIQKLFNLEHIVYRSFLLVIITSLEDVLVSVIINRVSFIPRIISKNEVKMNVTVKCFVYMCERDLPGRSGSPRLAHISQALSTFSRALPKASLRITACLHTIFSWSAGVCCVRLRILLAKNFSLRLNLFMRV